MTPEAQGVELDSDLYKELKKIAQVQITSVNYKLVSCLMEQSFIRWEMMSIYLTMSVLLYLVTILLSDAIVLSVKTRV